MIEAGGDVLARLRPSTGFQDIERTLFPDGVLNGQTVELSGNASSGKTLLLTQLIAKCILPSSSDGQFVGGCGGNVLLINTDHHFMVRKLRDVMLGMLNKNGISHENIVKGIIKNAFESLVIINCYSHSHYSVTLHTLHQMIDNKKIGLIAIDSIEAYYWENREYERFLTVEKYVEDWLKIIQKQTVPARVSVIYTKVMEDSEPQEEKADLKMINYRVKLMRFDETNFSCTVESCANKSFELHYEVNSNGIEWSDVKTQSEGEPSPEQSASE